MNQHLDESLTITGEIRAILFAIEELYMPGAEENLQFLHQTAADLFEKLLKELELLELDEIKEHLVN